MISSLNHVLFGPPNFEQHQFLSNRSTSVIDLPN